MRDGVDRRRLVGAEEGPASSERRGQQRQSTAGSISVADERVPQLSPPAELPGMPAGARTLPGEQNAPG